MRAVPVLAGLASALVVPALAVAHHAPVGDAPGSLVGVSVEVEGSPVPLYAAPDGSGRYYLEARHGARYAVRLDNRSHERLGVVLTVDGLNVISGERASFLGRWLPSDPGRMYVLEPWDSTLVKGWRTSLEDVRRFTFVDEEGSYATRSGKANAKMGWIEVGVYRERPRPIRRYWHDEISGGRPEREKDEDAPAEAPEARSAPRRPSDGEKAYGAPSPPQSYPGTGWGSRAEDPAIVVDFRPERNPAERITLRYEYARALRALGIDPRPWWEGDRLWQRERGGGHFAEPPR